MQMCKCKLDFNTLRAAGNEKRKIIINTFISTTDKRIATCRILYAFARRVKSCVVASFEQQNDFVNLISDTIYTLRSLALALPNYEDRHNNK